MTVTRVYMMIGLPGSGKTHWLQQKTQELNTYNIWSLNFLRAEYAQSRGCRMPELHPFGQDLLASDYMRAWEYCKKRPQEFGKYSNKRLSAFVRDLTQDIPLFIDNMNLYQGKRKPLIERCRHYGAEVVGVFIDTGLELCHERQQKTRGLDFEVLEDMMLGMDIPDPKEFDQFIYV